MRNLYIEAYPYHFETLYPFVADHAHPEDVILHHVAAPGQVLFDVLDQEKRPFTLLRMLRELVRARTKRVYVNSVSMNLYPRTVGAAVQALRLVAVPYICKAFNCEVLGLVHEADQFFSVPAPMNRRHRWFMKAYGRLHIRLYDEVFVLDPDVSSYLRAHGVPSLKVIETTSLTELVGSTRENQRKGLKLAWIGTVHSQRREWKPLTALPPDLLAEHGVVIDMLCDIRRDEGSALVAALKERELTKFFETRDYRPDDIELLRRVAECDAVLCLTASPAYGKTKTSGAKHIARAFNKPTIRLDGPARFVVGDGRGHVTGTFGQLGEAIASLRQPPFGKRQES